ncbi:hypothetical protein, partial [Cytophaga sp. FL35]|uniref:hypothetical protein n=1 Tax=Cytophaga sp. FL35 TaxID=1904456 RepID=UPI001CA3ED29
MMYHSYNIPEFDKLYYTVVGIIVFAVLLLFIVEIIAKLNKIPNDNVNLIIRDWAYGKLYFITFFFGIVTSHLFLGTSVNWFNCKKIGIPFDCSIFDVLVIAFLSLSLLIIGIIFQKKRTTKKFQIILFTIGLI